MARDPPEKGSSMVMYNNHGSAYASKRDYARAIVDYHEALTLQSLFSVARKNRERALTAILMPPK
jgi:hypothetical protein